MFKHIMTPVDLGHAGKLDRALEVTAELAKLYGADVTFVGVASNAPSGIAHNPEEFKAKLSDFAEGQKADRGIAKTAGHAVVVPDPAVELDEALAQAATETGADLVVMGSHIPHIFQRSSHGATLATHTNASILLVRDAD